jgi:hypothetical protein
MENDRKTTINYKKLDDRKIIVNYKEVMDAWYEAQDAIVAEAEARKEFEHLHRICEERKKYFYDLIADAEDYEDTAEGERGGGK